MKLAVTAETTIDLTPALLEEFDIRTIPLGITLEGKDMKDGEMTTDEMFEYVAKTGVLPKTNAVNEFEYGELFTSLLKEYDGVVHISISSEISSCCANAKSAAEKLNNVFVVDSRSLSTGIAQLAIYARNLSQTDLSAKEIYEKVQARTAMLQVSFELERLDYLYKGGRCSSLQFFGANLLKLRPRIMVKDGKMGADKKYRGKIELVVRKYCRDTLNEYNTPDKSLVFITYTTATPEMLNEATSACKEAGFERIEYTRAGGKISSHCGEHTLGILYFNDGPEKIEVSN